MKPAAIEDAMIYTGIDYHKRYSVACTLDAQGRRLSEAKIDHNSPEAFARRANGVEPMGSGRVLLYFKNKTARSRLLDEPNAVR